MVDYVSLKMKMALLLLGLEEYEVPGAESFFPLLSISLLSLPTPLGNICLSSVKCPTMFNSLPQALSALVIGRWHVEGFGYF